MIRLSLVSSCPFLVDVVEFPSYSSHFGGSRQTRERLREFLNECSSDDRLAREGGLDGVTPKKRLEHRRPVYGVSPERWRAGNEGARVVAAARCLSQAHRPDFVWRSPVFLFLIYWFCSRLACPTCRRSGKSVRSTALVLSPCIRLATSIREQNGAVGG